MSRALRVVLALVLPVLVIAGCGPTSTGSVAPSAAATPTTATPTSAAQGTADNAPIDPTCPATSTTAFAKTKFVGHAGLAFGAFHRYLWKPYRAGTFGRGASGRVTAFVKGGLAALFVKREVRLADEDAKADPTLCRAIAAPLATIGNDVTSAVDELRSGNAAGVNGVDSAISSVESSSGTQGTPITENEDPDLSSTPR